jgi:hypothetical protein
MANVVALTFGGLYLLVGVVGFIMTPSGGVVLGIFPVNPFHHVFHIVLGGLGLVAGWRRRGRLYCRVAGSVFIGLGLIGLIVPPLTAALFAYPGADLLTDNLLHLMTGIALTYFGFVPRPRPLVGSDVAEELTS